MDFLYYLFNLILQFIDYIDHRKYIEDYRMGVEKYKEKVELEEYLENADYS